MLPKLEPKPIPLITWRNMTPPSEGHTYFHLGHTRPFQPEADRFSGVNAWWLSEASLLAYAGEDYAAPRFMAAGWETVKFFSGRSTQCYVASNRDVAVVAFRGTEWANDQDAETMENFVADLYVDIDIRWTNAEAGGKIHRGFHDGLNEIWDDLRVYVDRLSGKGRRLWIAGHSLGGALAVLTGARMSNVQGIYTYGAPRVGNRDFVANYPHTLHRIVNNNDVIPHLPTFPYADLGELHYIDSSGCLHNDITFWQRWKDEIQGHIDCLVENIRNLDKGWIATLPDGIKDHTPLLYALHMWNSLISEK